MVVRRKERDRNRGRRVKHSNSSVAGFDAQGFGDEQKCEGGADQENRGDDVEGDGLVRGDVLGPDRDVGAELAAEIAPRLFCSRNSRAGGERGVTERKILEHLALGEADVHAIEIGHDVAEKEEREQADVSLVVRLRFKIFGG